MTLLAALAVGAGAALVVVSFLLRARERQQELERLLALPYGDEDTEIADAVQHVGLLQPGIGAVDEVLRRLNVWERLARTLERGRLPLRPGEVVLGTIVVTIAVALWAWALTGRPVLAAVALPTGPAFVTWLLRHRVSARRRAFETQLPGALSILGSSLQAGHTLLRAIQLLVEESRPPIAEEFQRIVAETQLGVPITEAMAHVADRIESREFEWVVHAVGIQQRVGGQLAELLFTLSEYMRAREEVRREVQVLTAEGRLSAWILCGLPIFVGLFVQATNPGYLVELTRGTGLLLLVAAGVFAALGVVVITRMVKAVEL